MIKFFDKYWLLLFFVANTCQQYTLFKQGGDFTFYLSLFIAALYVLFHVPGIFRPLQRRFSFVLAFCLILVVYQFTFGLMHINPKTWTYLIGKVVTSLAIAISVYKNRHSAEKTLPWLIVLSVPAMAIYGYQFDNEVFDGRNTMGFGNPNSLGAISAIGFGFCHMLESKNFSKFIKVLSLFFAFFALMSGSRAAILLILVALLVKYGVTCKNIMIIAAFAYAAVIVPPKLGFHPIGMKRFIETTQSNDPFSAGREEERRASIIMIRANPITGNGLYAEQSDEAKRVSELGSHNGYIDLVKMLGIPFGFLLIGYMALCLYRILRYYQKMDTMLKLHLFVVLACVVSANFESYLWGVNQFVTTLFIISFCVCQQKVYELELLHNKEKK